MPNEPTRPQGANADEWAAWLEEHEGSYGFIAVQIAEAIEQHQMPNEPTIEADDMIERIAIALWHRFGSPHQIEWHDDVHKAEFRDAAKSVVKAMREPSRSTAQ